MGGAGGSLRAGVTENPVRLTHSVRDSLTRVTCGGAPVYVWPGGGITFMVDVSPNAGARLRLRAHTGAGRPHRIHFEADGLRGSGWLHGSRSSAGIDPARRRPPPSFRESGQSVAAVLGEIAEVRIVERSEPRSDCLPDGDRLHLHDGPIDLIVEAFGVPAEINTAYRAAAARFVVVLDELCGELSLLRQPARRDGPPQSA